MKASTSRIPYEVDAVLGERDVTAYVAVAEQALRRLEAIALALPGFEEVLANLDEIGAVELKSLVPEPGIEPG
jgi:hypothetical protein